MLWQRFILPPFCAGRIPRTVIARWNVLQPTCSWSRNCSAVDRPLIPGEAGALGLAFSAMKNDFSRFSSNQAEFTDLVRRTLLLSISARQGTFGENLLSIDG